MTTMCLFGEVTNGLLVEALQCGSKGSRVPGPLAAEIFISLLGALSPTPNIE